MKQPDKAKLKAELQRIEQQIENVIDTLATIGKSDALTARLHKLEAEKSVVAAKLTQRPEPLQVVPNASE